MAFDTIIKNGLIYDGTIAEPFHGDIGISGDRITAVGSIPDGIASTTIDAENHIVTPGFIDIHTHCDMSFQRSKENGTLSAILPLIEGNDNYRYQGVTTVITGNCGQGFSETDDWLDYIDTINFGTNVGHLAPHGMIRQDLFGEHQPRELDKNQLEAMKIRIAAEMEKGAFGISTGLGYEPGFHANTDELIALAMVAKQYDGVYTTHIRDPSGRSGKNGEPGIIASIKEAIEIGRQTGISVQISHLFICVPENGVQPIDVLNLIENAQAGGINIHADQHPYDSASSMLTIHLPDAFRTGSGVKAEYKTSDGKRKIEDAIKQVFSYLGPDKMLIGLCPGNPSYEGKTIKEIAEIEDKTPSACYADMVCGDAVMGVWPNRNMETVREIMAKDYVMTASDGFTVPKDFGKFHPRCYGTFPRKIRKHVLDEKLVDLSTAIRSMTSLPAEKFKIRNRGMIAEGYYADIAVIDLSTITDKATYENPHQYSEGIEYLLVNGVRSIENGKVTGKRGGRALKNE